MRTEESEVSTHLKVKGEKFEALLGEIKDDREERNQWAASRESTRQRKADIECHTCHQKGHFAQECPATTADRRSGNGLGPGFLL